MYHIFIYLHDVPPHRENRCLVCLITNGKCGTPVFWIQCRWCYLERSCTAICGFVLEPDECDHWFWQESVTCHTANETMNILRHFFGDRLISKIISPPHYPELTLPDFFLWGHLKEKDYNDNPHVEWRQENNFAGNKHYHSYNVETHAAQYAQSCGIVPARKWWTLPIPVINSISILFVCM